MFVASMNQELSVLNHLDDRPTKWQRLRGNSRTVAIVNAVVTALEKIAVTIFHLLQGVLNRLVPLIFCGERIEGNTGDPEETFLGVRVNDPVGYPVPEEPVSITEKLVEERLDRSETQHVLPLHHLP